MSWLIPSALGIAGAAATRSPSRCTSSRAAGRSPRPLPTARFVPERPIHARTRSLALTDLLLLLMLRRRRDRCDRGGGRRSDVRGRTGRVARVIVARSLARGRKHCRGTRQRALRSCAPDDVDHRVRQHCGARRRFSIPSRRVAARGSLSAALAAATRVAAVLAAPGADSVELVLVSPLATGGDRRRDRRNSRATWPGRIRLPPVAAIAEREHRARASKCARPPTTPSPPGSSLMGVVAPSSGSVRLVRGALTRDGLGVGGGERACARSLARVATPTRRVGAAGVDRRDRRRDRPDRRHVVARFPRLWLLEGDAVARWADGEPAP